VRGATSGGYYEEVVIISEGSRAESGTLIGVGPGLCGLPRMPLLSKHLDEYEPRQ
jgi:hypothetical protein